MDLKRGLTRCLLVAWVLWFCWLTLFHHPGTSDVSWFWRDIRPTSTRTEARMRSSLVAQVLPELGTLRYSFKLTHYPAITPGINSNV